MIVFFPVDFPLKQPLDSLIQRGRRRRGCGRQDQGEGERLQGPEGGGHGGDPGPNMYDQKQDQKGFYTGI